MWGVINLEYDIIFTFIPIANTCTHINIIISLQHDMSILLERKKVAYWNAKIHGYQHIQCSLFVSIKYNTDAESFPSIQMVTVWDTYLLFLLRSFVVIS